jgi:serralysin
LIGGAGTDILQGGDGNDTLDGGLGSDTMDGGAGDDTYFVNGADNITDSSGTDTVKSALTFSLVGHDDIENLTLTGATAINGTGNDGDNFITGNAAANILTGGLGNDTLDGGLGNDNMIGGDGNDTYFVNSVLDKVTENANEGTDTVKTTVTLTLAANVENLTLLGVAAINGTGNAGDNSLTGNGAGNILSGGAGADTLDGRGGNDRLTGGADADTFLFDTGPSDALNHDDITDFVHGEDIMQFDSSVYDAAGAPGALDPAAFNSGAGLSAAADADDRFVYNTTSGALYYDADGVGGTAAVQVATLTNQAAIDSTDLLIV